MATEEHRFTISDYVVDDDDGDDPLSPTSPQQQSPSHAPMARVQPGPSRIRERDLPDLPSPTSQSSLSNKSPTASVRTPTRQQSTGMTTHLPLGPGPQPQPESPEGYTLDPLPQDQFVPKLTYPPRAVGTGNGRSESGSNSAPYDNGLRPRPSLHPHGGRTPSPGAPQPSPSPQPTNASLMSPRSDFTANLFDDDEKRMSRVEKGFSTVPEPLQLQPKQSRLTDLFFPPSLPCRLLLMTVFIETAIDIAIQANILWRFNLEVDAGHIIDEKTRKRLPVYLYIFISAHLVQLGLTFWAVARRNTIQVIALAIFNGMFLIYAAMEIAEIRQIAGSQNDTPAAELETTNKVFVLPLNILTAIVVAIVAACEVVIIILTWYIWREFGWRIYRFLGADLRIRRYYFCYQIFECIVTFSFFFFAGFGIQFIFLVLGDQKTDPEYVVTWVMLPLSLIWLGMGICAARWEIGWLMLTFLVGILASSAYFIFKLVRIWVQLDKYENFSKSLTVFSALALVMIALCLGYGLVVWRNFGKGLKEQVLGSKKRDSDSLPLSPQYPSSRPGNIHRLTID